MSGELATIVGGAVAAAAGFYRHALALLGQGAGVDPGQGAGVTTGIGVAGLIVALIPLVDRVLKHREAMQDSQLRDRVGDLEERLARESRARGAAGRERDQMKQVLAKMFPVLVEMNTALEEDRAALRWAKAKLGDDLPMPDRFGRRDFDDSIQSLLSAGQLALLANTPPSSEVLDIIEGRRPMPTPDPDAGNSTIAPAP